jgi:bifunctional DNA-binding transcriptional regulator/antitoxin component of YhaV-PrlF toxin-antitoxin module
MTDEQDREITTTLNMSESGRIILPKQVRKPLGIDDNKAIVEVTVRVIERLDDTEE